MRKLLCSFLFFISSKSFPKRLSTPSLGLLCVVMFFVVNFANAQAISSTWALTANGNAVTTGNVSASAIAIGSGLNNLTYTAGSGATTGSWSNDASSLRGTEYYEFTVTPAAGYTLNVTNINFQHSVSSGDWQVQAYYSTDNFATSTALSGAFSSSSTTPTARNTAISIPSITTSITIRIYGWESDGNNRSLRIRNFVVNGTISCAPVTISNAGLDQNSNTSFSLAANTPSVGTGAWAIVSGPSTSLSQFSNTSSPTATFTPIGTGTYTLRWTISNGCNTSTDDVVLIANCVSNLITNGDFSNGATGWAKATTKGAYVEVLNENVYFNNGNTDNTAELDSEASLRQDVTVIPNISYTLSFLYARRPGSPASVAVDVKLFGGSTASINYTTTNTTNTPLIGTLTFTPTTSSLGIEFYNSLGTTTLGAIIDNIVLIPTSQVTPMATTTPKGDYKTTKVCVGVPVQLDVDNVPSSGVTYSWSSTSPGAVFSSTTIKNPTITFSSAGNEQKATVVVTTSSGCSGTPSTTYFNVQASPTVYAVTGGGSYCSGGSGVAVGLANSTSGVNYQLQLNGINNGGVVAGTGSAITFGLKTAAGTYTVVATNTSTNNCSLNMNGNAVITIDPTSVGGSIAGSTTVCSGSNSTTLTLSGHTGSVTRWESSPSSTFASSISNIANTTTSLVVTNLTATTYYRAVVTSGTCASANSGTAIITVNPNPTANAGATLSAICQGATSAAMGGSVGGGATGGTWTGGSGTWTNANNPSTARYIAGASESGSITLTLTTSGGSCGTATATKTITVNPNPTATAGTALSAICQGATSAAMGGSVGGGATGGTWTGGSGTWTNANNPSTARYIAGASELGTITLTLTTSGGSCGTTSVTKTITVNPNNTIALSSAAGTDSQTVCANTAISNITYATTGATGAIFSGLPAGVTGAWAGNVVTISGTPTTEVGSPFNYTVTLTNGCGNISATGTITVKQVHAAPTITKNNDVSCGSFGSITLTGLSGNWTINQTGTTTPPKTYSGTVATHAIQDLIVGTYYFTITNDLNCTSSSATVTINDISSNTTWNGSVWSNGEPDGSKSVLITSVVPSQPFSAAKPNITACSLTINVPNGATDPDVIIPSQMTLNITNAITSNGKLVFESGSSLLQGASAVNTGTISYKRKVSMRRYDVVYWATPVTDASLTMYKFSPNTLFDKYHYWNATTTKWVLSNYGGKVMEMGQGYSIRGPQYFDLVTPQIFEGVFVGVPNNGDVSFPVVANKLNLIGNPYPSPVDADELMLENKDKLGSLYFWTHNQPPQLAPGTNTFKYLSSDFVVYNGTGSVRVNNEIVTGADEFKGYIGAGQAFFAIPPGTAVKFKNEFRKGSSENTQFYKTAKTSKIEKNRLWLNIANSQGAFKQILIGYIEGATNAIDVDYDAVTMGSNSYIDFYTLNESKKLTVQGRGLPFDNTEIIPLGYKSGVDDKGDRNFTISIDHADGFFTTQPVYLEDKVTGKVIDLRKENYTFFSAAETNTTRFSLRYTNKTLGTGEFENLENTVLVSVKDKTVSINSSKETIKEVNVYNIGAELLYSNSKVNASQLQIKNLHSSDQVLLVKITLENGHTFTKKVIFSNL